MEDMTRLEGRDLDFENSFVGQDSSVFSEEPSPTVIGLCGGCGSHLAWPTPIAGRKAEAMSCPECGRYYFTIAQDMDLHRMGGFTPVPQFAHDQSRSDVNSMTQLLLDKVLGSRRDMVGRRHDTRYPVSRSIVGVPLDDSLSPSRETISMTLIDLSMTGAGVLCDEAFSEKQIVFDFALLGCPGVQVLAQERWRDCVGSTVKVGFEFMRDI